MFSWKKVGGNFAPRPPGTWGCRELETLTNCLVVSTRLELFWIISPKVNNKNMFQTTWRSLKNAQVGSPDSQSALVFMYKAHLENAKKMAQPRKRHPLKDLAKLEKNSPTAVCSWNKGPISLPTSYLLGSQVVWGCYHLNRKKKWHGKCYQHIAPENWYLEDKPFILAPGLFSRAMIVSGRVLQRVLFLILPIQR